MKRIGSPKNGNILAFFTKCRESPVRAFRKKTPISVRRCRGGGGGSKGGTDNVRSFVTFLHWWLPLMWLFCFCRSAFPTWCSRLSRGWDIPTLLLTRSSIQYSIGEIYINSKFKIKYSIGEKSPFFIFTNFISLYTPYQPKIAIQSIPIHIQS